MTQDNPASSGAGDSPNNPEDRQPSDQPRRSQSAPTGTVDPESVLTEEELERFAIEAERLRLEREAEANRAAAFKQAGADLGLSEKDAAALRRQVEAQAKKEEAERRRLEEKARKDAQKKLDDAAAKAEREAKAEKKKEAKKEKSKKTSRERRFRKARKEASRSAARTVGAATSESLVADLILLGSMWGIFGVGVVILPFLLAFWGAIAGLIAQLDESMLGQLLGIDLVENGGATTGRGAISSPLEGVTLQELVDYKPTHGQSFGPKTGNQRSYGEHGGVDFDSRVGGTAGRAVLAVEPGEVVEVSDLCGDGSSYRIIYQGTGPTVLDQPVAHRAVHVSQPSVSVGDTVSAGQQIAVVAVDDCVSQGTHYDHKINLGSADGPWYDPQEYFRKAIEFNAASQAGGPEGEVPNVALDMIRQFESFHSTPYWDYAQWSHGYGTKAPCSTEAECAASSITREEAEQEMRAYLAKHCTPLLTAVSVYDEMLQGQKGAYLSLCYNLGPEQFQESDPYASLVAGDIVGGCRAFDFYVHADGVRLPGLVRRRNTEQEYCGVQMPWNN